MTQYPTYNKCISCELLDARLGLITSKLQPELEVGRIDRDTFIKISVRDVAFRLFLSHLSKVDHPKVYLLCSCYPLPFTYLFSEHTPPPQCPPSQEKVPGSVPPLSTAMGQAVLRQVTPNQTIPTPQIQGIQEASTDQANHHPHHLGGLVSPARTPTLHFLNMEADP